MNTERKLLVVDDEKYICDACTRIFGVQGFDVDTSTDSTEGLSRALDTSYDAILLDMKMPLLDGVGFLEELRKEESKRQSPATKVIVITGYPDERLMAASKRLGVMDYIPKPFKPNEIKDAVRRVVEESSVCNLPTESSDSALAQLTEQLSHVSNSLFFEESWVKVLSDDAACVGAVLPLSVSSKITNVQLPHEGDVVTAGLPLAQFSLENAEPFTVLSPLSGIVSQVNDSLRQAENGLWTSPCEKAWIACIQPTDFTKNIAKCETRRAAYLSTNEEKLRGETEILEKLGCEVEKICELSMTAAERVLANETPVVLIDADSYGTEGPAIVSSILSKLPKTKVIVLGDEEGTLEQEYRQNRILFYALNPFKDMEIIEILDAAFKNPISIPTRKKSSSEFSSAISKIRITNRHGRKVSLIAEEDLLLNYCGVGRNLIDILLNEGCPVEVFLKGEGDVLGEICEETKWAEKTVLLQAKRMGRIPGTVICDNAPEWNKILGSLATAQITRLSLQPSTIEDEPTLALDARTVTALSKKLVKTMFEQ